MHKYGYIHTWYSLMLGWVHVVWRRRETVYFNAQYTLMPSMFDDVLRLDVVDGVSQAGKKELAMCSRRFFHLCFLFSRFALKMTCTVLYSILPSATTFDGRCIKNELALFVKVCIQLYLPSTQFICCPTHFIRWCVYAPVSTCELWLCKTTYWAIRKFPTNTETPSEIDS